MVTATRSLLGRERRGQREGSQDRRRVSYNSSPRVRLFFLFFFVLYTPSLSPNIYLKRYESNVYCTLLWENHAVQFVNWYN